MAKEAQEIAQTGFREREAGEEESRHRLYSETSPSIFRTGHRENRSTNWFFSGLSLFGFWDVHKPAELDSEQLLEKKVN